MVLQEQDAEMCSNVNHIWAKLKDTCSSLRSAKSQKSRNKIFSELRLFLGSDFNRSCVQKWRGWALIVSSVLQILKDDTRNVMSNLEEAVKVYTMLPKAVPKRKKRKLPSDLASIARKFDAMMPNTGYWNFTKHLLADANKAEGPVLHLYPNGRNAINYLLVFAVDVINFTANFCHRLRDVRSHAAEPFASHIYCKISQILRCLNSRSWQLIESITFYRVYVNILSITIIDQTLLLVLEEPNSQCTPTLASGISRESQDSSGSTISYSLSEQTIVATAARNLYSYASFDMSKHQLLQHLEYYGKYFASLESDSYITFEVIADTKMQAIVVLVRRHWSFLASHLLSSPSGLQILRFIQRAWHQTTPRYLANFSEFISLFFKANAIFQYSDLFRDVTVGAIDDAACTFDCKTLFKMIVQPKILCQMIQGSEIVTRNVILYGYNQASNFQEIEVGKTNPRSGELLCITLSILPMESRALSYYKCAADICVAYEYSMQLMSGKDDVNLLQNLFERNMVDPLRIGMHNRAPNEAADTRSKFHGAGPWLFLFLFILSRYGKQLHHGKLGFSWIDPKIYTEVVLRCLDCTEIAMTQMAALYVSIEMIECGVFSEILQDGLGTKLWEILLRQDLPYFDTTQAALFRDNVGSLTLRILYACISKRLIPLSILHRDRIRLQKLPIFEFYKLYTTVTNVSIDGGRESKAVKMKCTNSNRQEIWNLQFSTISLLMTVEMLWMTTRDNDDVGCDSGCIEEVYDASSTLHQLLSNVYALVKIKGLCEAGSQAVLNESSDYFSALACITIAALLRKDIITTESLTIWNLRSSLQDVMIDEKFTDTWSKDCNCVRSENDLVIGHSEIAHFLHDMYSISGCCGEGSLMTRLFGIGLDLLKKSKSRYGAMRPTFTRIRIPHELYSSVLGLRETRVKASGEELYESRHRGIPTFSEVDQVEMQALIIEWAEQEISAAEQLLDSLESPCSLSHVLAIFDVSYVLAIMTSDSAIEPGQPWPLLLERVWTVISNACSAAVLYHHATHDDASATAVIVFLSRMSCLLCLFERSTDDLVFEAFKSAALRKFWPTLKALIMALTTSTADEGYLDMVDTCSAATSEISDPLVSDNVDDFLDTRGELSTKDGNGIVCHQTQQYLRLWTYRVLLHDRQSDVCALIESTVLDTSLSPVSLLALAGFVLHSSSSFFSTEQQTLQLFYKLIAHALNVVDSIRMTRNTELSITKQVVERCFTGRHYVFYSQVLLTVKQLLQDPKRIAVAKAENFGNLLQRVLQLLENENPERFWVGQVLHLQILELLFQAEPDLAPDFPDLCMDNLSNDVLLVRIIAIQCLQSVYYMYPDGGANIFASLQGALKMSNMHLDTLEHSNSALRERIWHRITMWCLLLISACSSKDSLPDALFVFIVMAVEACKRASNLVPAAQLWLGSVAKYCEFSTVFDLLYAYIPYIWTQWCMKQINVQLLRHDSQSCAFEFSEYVQNFPLLLLYDERGYELFRRHSDAILSISTLLEALLLINRQDLTLGSFIATKKLHGLLCEGNKQDLAAFEEHLSMELFAHSAVLLANSECVAEDEDAYEETAIALANSAQKFAKSVKDLPSMKNRWLDGNDVKSCILARICRIIISVRVPQSSILFSAEPTPNEEDSLLLPLIGHKIGVLWTRSMRNFHLLAGYTGQHLSRSCYSERVSIVPTAICIFTYLSSFGFNISSPEMWPALECLDSLLTETYTIWIPDCLLHQFILRNLIKTAIKLLSCGVNAKHNASLDWEKLVQHSERVILRIARDSNAAVTCIVNNESYHRRYGGLLQGMKSISNTLQQYVAYDRMCLAKYALDDQLSLISSTSASYTAHGDGQTNDVYAELLGVEDTNNAETSKANKATIIDIPTDAADIAMVSDDVSFSFCWDTYCRTLASHVRQMLYLKLLNTSHSDENLTDEASRNTAADLADTGALNRHKYSLCPGQSSLFMHNLKIHYLFRPTLANFDACHLPEAMYAKTILNFVRMITKGQNARQSRDKMRENCIFLAQLLQTKTGECCMSRWKVEHPSVYQYIMHISASKGTYWLACVDLLPFNGVSMTEMYFKDAWRSLDTLGHSNWMCRITSLLLWHCSKLENEDKTLEIFGSLASLHKDLAAMLFPYTLYRILQLPGQPFVATATIAGIEWLFTSVVTQKISSFCEAAQTLLHSLHFLRDLEKKVFLDSPGSSATIDHGRYAILSKIDLLIAANAAIDVKMLYTAMQFTEIWLENKFGHIHIERTCFSDTDKSYFNQVQDLLVKVYACSSSPKDLSLRVHSQSSFETQLIMHLKSQQSEKAIPLLDTMLRSSGDGDAINHRRNDGLESLFISLRRLGYEHLLDSCIRSSAIQYPTLFHTSTVGCLLMELDYERRWKQADWTSVAALNSWAPLGIHADGKVTTYRHQRTLFHALKALSTGDTLRSLYLVEDSQSKILDSLHFALQGLEENNDIHNAQLNLEELRKVHTVAKLFEIQSVNSTSLEAASAEQIFSVWRQRHAQISGDFDAMERILSLEIVLLKLFVRRQSEEFDFAWCNKTVAHLHLSQARCGRKSHRIAIAWKALQVLEELDANHQLDVVNQVRWRLEEAKVLWKQDDCRNAIRIAQEINIGLNCDLENLSATDMIALQLLRVRVLTLLGKWAASQRSESSSFIIEKYFNNATTTLDALGARNEYGLEVRSTKIAVKAYTTLANYMADMYQHVQARVTSSEWQAGKRVVEARRRELTACLGMDQADQIENRSHIHALSREIENDDEERLQIESSVIQFLLGALKNYGRGLRYGTAKDELAILYRVISLWFSSNQHGDVNATMQDVIHMIPSYKLVPLSYQIISRIGTEVVLQSTPHADNKSAQRFEFVLEELVLKLAQHHPHQVLIHLIALKNSADVEGRGSAEFRINVGDAKSEAAKKYLSKLARSDQHKLLQSLDVVIQAYITLALLDTREYHHSNRRIPLSRVKFMIKTKTSSRKESTSSIPFEYCLRHCREARPCVLTCPIVPRADMDYSSIARIQSFDPCFAITDSGIHRPKILYCNGTDGKKYKQLVKGKDDTRQDLVIEQVFETMNRFLKEDPNTEMRKLRLYTYKVVPLSPIAGVLEWVDNTLPWGSYLVGPAGKSTSAHERYHPHEWKHTKCRTYLKNAKNKMLAYQEIEAKFTPVFHHFFLEHYADPAQWYQRRLAYIKSVAVNSFVGYILGIGDRHSQNILIHKDTAELVHIDFGVVFDQGLALFTPETVPFRLTRDIVDGMGINGCDGVFARSAEATMHLLRKKSASVVTILEVLVHDPLYRWTLSPLKALKIQDRCLVSMVAVDVHQEDTEIPEPQSNYEDAAKRALIRVKQKLGGYEDPNGNALSIEGQVKHLIQVAQDPQNLSRLFPGWAPWI